ncbi:methyltransferase protein [Vigna angularis]|uniref:Methyltransferase n=1 Tax=Phaseolus angularis TaxID=3914 RepID=A0A8T0KQ35_PHAAN|nr:methyltransferase protein [Vigna angularis]
MANTDSSSPTIFNVRKTPTFILLLLLCIASYFLAAYHQGAPLLTTASLYLSASCNHLTAQTSRTCEPMSTYPRTYDLIHADSVFSLYSNRCELEDILLEMDRIVRPEGCVIIRDDVDMLVRVKSIVNGLEWDSIIVDHEDGHLEKEKVLFAVGVHASTFFAMQNITVKSATSRAMGVEHHPITAGRSFDKELQKEIALDTDEEALGAREGR